jgi:hypothetical protein
MTFSRQKALEAMGEDGFDGPRLPLKALLAALAAGAIALGLALPIPHKSEAEPQSQFTTLELGAG